MGQKIKITGVFVDKISKDSARASKNLEKSMQGAAKSTKGLSVGMAALSGAAGGVAAILALKVLSAVKKLPGAFISASESVETLTLQFKSLLGSTEAAQARMEDLIHFAASTPFQLNQVARASKTLETLTQGALSTGEGLRLVGDAAAATGADFQNLAMHVGRAYDGLQANRPVGESMMRLQELGIISGATRNEIEQLQKAGKGKEAWQTLQTQLKKTEGAMEDLSNSAAGMKTTIADTIDIIFRQTMSEGLFESYKKGLKGVRDVLTGIAESGVFKRLGVAFSSVLKIFGQDIDIKIDDVVDKAIRIIEWFGRSIVNVSAIIKNTAASIKGIYDLIVDGIALVLARVKADLNTLINEFKIAFNQIVKIVASDYALMLAKITTKAADDFGEKSKLAQSLGYITEAFIELRDNAVKNIDDIQSKSREGTVAIDILKANMQKTIDNVGASYNSVDKIVNKTLSDLKKLREESKKSIPITTTTKAGGTSSSSMTGPPAPDFAAMAAGADAASQATRAMIEFINRGLGEIERKIEAQKTLRDIAIASITDQFDAARAELKANTNDQIVEIQELMDNYIITFEEGQNAITMILEQAAERRKELSKEEFSYKTNKLHEWTSVVAEGVNTVSGTLRNLYAYQKESLDIESNQRKENVKSIVKGRRNQAKALLKIEKEAAEERKKIQRQDLMASMIMAIANTAQAVTKALASLPPPASFVMAGIAGVAGAVQVGIIASQMSKLADGGIIKGQGNKDTEPALLTPGEMVINKEQQARLFAIANGRASGIGGGNNISISDTIIVNGNVDDDSIAQIKQTREDQLRKLEDDIEELSYRGRLALA